jgi:nitroreductase
MTDETLLADLVALAARAPSPHNTQPWSPRVVAGAGGPGAAGPAVEVAVVPGRTLPAGDPTFRDVLLSLGAWVECAAVGAAAAGRALVVEPLPALRALDALPVRGAADPRRPVLRVRLGGAAAGPPTATPDDVRERAVYRGDLAGDPAVYADLPAGTLAPGLSLRAVDAAVLARLVRWGGIGTFARRPVVEELVHWLRLDPRHPGYARDGLNDRVLLLPPALARLAAPVTRRPWLRDPALAVLGAAARAADRVLAARWRAGARGGAGVAAPGAAGAGAAAGAPGGVHHVLVADAPDGPAGGPGRGSGPSRAPVLDGRTGLPEERVVEAGRSLQRLWLHAHRAGHAVSPHSEVIDVPGPHAALRRHLGLGRSEVALAVFSTGRPLGEVPRAPRLPA